MDLEKAKQIIQRCGFSEFIREAEKTGREEEIVVAFYNHLQKTGYFDEYFSCKSKTTYYTEKEATNAAYRISEWRKREYEPYVCLKCGFYHVGRFKENRRR